MGDFGLSLGAPDQLPLYISSVSRLGAGALLVVGGAAAVNAFRNQPRTRRVLLVPSVVVTVVLIVLYLVREQIPNFDALLPAFVGPIGVKAMITEPRFAGAMPDVTGIALLIQAVSAALFLVGMFAYRRLVPARRSGRGRLPGRGHAHRGVRRDPFLLLPGRV